MEAEHWETHSKEGVALRLKANVNSAGNWKVDFLAGENQRSGCEVQSPRTILSWRDCCVSPSPQKNLSELFGGNRFPEVAFDCPVMPTSGPRGSAWGGKVTFVLEKASRWGSRRGGNEAARNLGKALQGSPWMGRMQGKASLSLCVI